PDLTNTHPAAKIGPFAQWTDARRIVSLDPWGHLVAETFGSEMAEGLDVRPTIAVTEARLDIHEIQDALAVGRLLNDGDVVHNNGGLSGGKDRHDSGLDFPWIRGRFWHNRAKPSPLAVRTDRRHVSRTGDPA